MPSARAARSSSMRVTAVGVRAGNVPGPRRSTARAMRRTAVRAGGADACPPSPRALRRSVSTPFSPTPTIAARPRTNGRGAADDGTALVEYEPWLDAAVPQRLGDHACGPAERLLVAAERQVHVARRREAGREEVLDGIHHHHQRSLVIEGATTVDPAVLDASARRADGSRRRSRPRERRRSAP